MTKASKFPLCITSWHLNLVSETFIARHRWDLLPGQTLNFAVMEGEPPPRNDGVVVAEKRPRSFVRRAYEKIVHRRPSWAPLLEDSIRLHGTTAILGEYLNHSFTFFSALRQRAGLRLFAHAHGYDISLKLREPLWPENYRRLADMAVLITPSEFARQLLAEHGVPAERVVVIPYGTSFPKESEIPTRPTEPTGPLRFLAVGRMVGKKAPLNLLKAFQQAEAAHPGITLTVIGDGPLFDTAKAFVESAKLASRVTLLGRQPHDRVIAAFKEHDVYVQHSIVDPETGDMEGLPVAILEAMAWGLPVVSTLHAGIPEGVVHGETGLLSAENDVQTMAANIARLAADPPLVRTLGAAGRVRLEARFSWDVERASLLKLMFPEGPPQR